MLIAQGPPRSPLKMDENLVRSVRAVLASYPLEQRVFSRLKRQRATQGHPGLQRGHRHRPSGPLVFERVSGKPLTEGVPGMFTCDGYHKRFQNEVVVLDRPARGRRTRGCWARTAMPPTGLRDAAALGALDRPRAPALPCEEYVKVWEALLGDVRLICAPAASTRASRPRASCRA